MEATHVVVFSELSPKTKVQYTRFLLDHDVKFVKHASDGKYAASIRLHAANNAPHARSVDGKRLQKSVGDERGDTPEENPSAEKESSARLAGVPQELHQYVNLIALIGGRKDGGIKRPSGSGVFVKETRLVRLINEIYDARQEDGSSSSDSYSSNALDGNDGPLGTSNKSVSSSSNAFTHFIKHYLTNRFGLKKLVEQQAWELIEGLHSLQHRVDVELFTSFLRGRYSESTLLFTLFARATIQRLMSSSAYRPTLSKSTPNDRKTRKSASTTAATTLVWLSKAQVESLAQTIFGSKTEDSFLEFMHAMKAFVLSQPPGRTAAKLVEANELLFIAAETYQKSSSSSNTQGIDLQDVSTNHNLCQDDEDEGVNEEEEPATQRGYQQQTHFGLQKVQQHEPQMRTTSHFGGGVVGGETNRSKQSAISTPSPVSAVKVGGDSGDVQKRLGSLLERMKKRQQQPDE